MFGDEAVTYFPWGIDLPTLLKFNWKARWFETQVSGSLSLSADPEYQFKKWGLGSSEYSWLGVT